MSEHSKAPKKDAKEEAKDSTSDKQWWSNLDKIQEKKAKHELKDKLGRDPTAAEVVKYLKTFGEPKDEADKQLDNAVNYKKVD